MVASALSQQNSTHRIVNRLLFGLVIASLCFADSAQAALPSFEITVLAAKHERTNVLVRVQLPPSQLKADQIGSVTLAGSDGKAIPAQWTKPGFFASTGSELHFILPHLKAGKSVRLTAKLSVDSPPAGEGF